MQDCVNNFPAYGSLIMFPSFIDHMFYNTSLQPWYKSTDKDVGEEELLRSGDVFQMPLSKQFIRPESCLLVCWRFLCCMVLFVSFPPSDIKWGLLKKPE